MGALLTCEDRPKERTQCWASDYQEHSSIVAHDETVSS